MLKLIIEFLQWLDTTFVFRYLNGEIGPKDIFAGECLMSDVPFKLKKQEPEHHWFMPIDPEEAKQARKRWMDKHYGGEVHPVDL